MNDDYIDNRHNVKLLIGDLKIWHREYQHLFEFNPEISFDLTQNTKLMESIVCLFFFVFLFVILKLTKKFQCVHDYLTDAVDILIWFWLSLMAGFIIGFDGQKMRAA